MLNDLILKYFGVGCGSGWSCRWREEEEASGQKNGNLLKSFLRAWIVSVSILAAPIPSERLESPKIGQEIDWKGPAANALAVGVLKNTSMLND